MKKRFLSLLMVFCLMLSLAPAAFAVDEPVTTEAALTSALSSATAGDTITLGANITLTNPLTIGKAVTIDGTAEKYAITYAGTDTEYAITINAGVTGVTLKNLTITCANGVNVGASGATIDSCNINATRRGINFYLATTNSGATLDVKNSNIVNTLADETYGVYYNTDNRGIATGDITNGTINITGGTISGFKYAINPVISTTSSDTTRNGQGTKFNVVGTDILGWTALNVWSANTTYNFNDCELASVNKFSGGYNDFATIVLNDEANGRGTIAAPVVNVSGGSLTSVQYGTSSQPLIGVDYSCLSKVFFSTYGDNDDPVKMYMFGATEATIPGVFGFNTNYVSTQMQNSYIAASGYEDEGVVEPYWLVITSAAAVSNSVEDTYGIGNYEDLETPHNGGDTL